MTLQHSTFLDPFSFVTDATLPYSGAATLADLRVQIGEVKDWIGLDVGGDLSSVPTADLISRTVTALPVGGVLLQSLVG